MKFIIHILIIYLINIGILLKQSTCAQFRSCDCSCSNLDAVLESDPVLQKTIQELVKNLTVDAKTTSSHIRSLTSASDPRPSAQAAGYVGVILLSIVGGLMILVDLTRLFQFCSTNDIGNFDDINDVSNDSD